MNSTRLNHEFNEINAYTQNVLTNSLVTILRQENILTDKICNHSTIFDIAEVKNLLSANALAIGADRDRPINAVRERLILTIPTNYGISFEKEIIQAAIQL